MSPKQFRRKDAPKEKPYAQNKKAFDAVMIYFRRMDRPMLKPMGAVNPDGGSHGPNVKNPVKPLPLDFWSDVLLAIRAVLPRGVSLSNFMLAYLLYDSEIEVERNKHAIRVLGGRAHSVEQRLGAEFVRRKIWPLGGYLNPPRPSRFKV